MCSIFSSTNHLQIVYFWSEHHLELAWILDLTRHFLSLYAGLSSLAWTCLFAFPKYYSRRFESCGSRLFYLLNSITRAHRYSDILQTNVLIKADGSAVIADFGLSTIKLDVSSHSTTKLVVGTKRWMSPERMKGRRLAPPVDIYAWAMTAYEASCCNCLVLRPFSARSDDCIA
jgi:hypothetical protein